MMLAKLNPMFVLSNRLEAGLWTIIGIGCLVSALRTRKTEAFIAAMTFFAFGGSDVVESHTGAWWRPWWLLAWKGLCLLVFLILLIRRMISADRKALHPSATASHPPPATQNPDPPFPRSP
jgi:hypothetical protein